MHEYIYFLLLASGVNTIPARVLFQLNNYYWQEYKGVIPENALPAGYGEHDQLVYIGQASRDDILVPGKIYENDDNVYFEFNEHAWATNKSVKIFCTDHVENFEWIPVTVDEVDELREKTIVVIGGYQKKFLTFIGRVFLNGRTEVGKVICPDDQSGCWALYVNENGEYKEYSKCEILTYNAHNQNTTNTTESDTTKNTTTTQLIT